ncbi:hypothetical protein [Nostoc sp. CHAB 5715]|nr:hypothetical protein [Nostoc sp. CHAB 5715]
MSRETLVLGGLCLERNSPDDELTYNYMLPQSIMKLFAREHKV